jgi:superfamily II DNA helicase RecQ
VLDYAQKSGRAGRDRLRSKAVIIVQEGKQQAAKDKQTEAEQELVRAYVSIDDTTTCQQVVLDGYLDRRETEQVVCKEGEEKCNMCRRANRAEDNNEVEEEASEDSSSIKQEIDTAEAEQDKAQRVFKQQQQAQRGPRQTLI